MQETSLRLREVRGTARWCGLVLTLSVRACRAVPAWSQDIFASGATQRPPLRHSVTRQREHGPAVAVGTQANGASARLSVMDSRLRAAVDASVCWYEELFALHRIPHRMDDGLWWALAPPPPLHSAAKSVQPWATSELTLRRVATYPQCSVADSFGALVLPGFDLLFEARWLYREPLGKPRLRCRPGGRRCALPRNWPSGQLDMTRPEFFCRDFWRVPLSPSSGYVLTVLLSPAQWCTPAAASPHCPTYGRRPAATRTGPSWFASSTP